MIKQHTFTVDALMLMAEAGLFQDQKVELIDGVIYDMSSANPDHADAIDELTEKLVQVFSGRARVRVQNPLDVGDPHWLPHPDVLLIQRRSYGESHPRPDHVLLLIEVSGSSLTIDVGRKLERYATLGIEDYWIADLHTKEWIIHRDPAPGRYYQVTRVPFGKATAPVAFHSDVHVWL